MQKILPVFGFIVGIVLLVSCGKKPDVTYFYYTPEEKAILDQYLSLEEIPDAYQVTLPEHLSQNGLFPRQVSDAKATLGRVLFYDKKLSKDGTVACANCHRQDLAFSDDKAVSKGVYDREGDRNSIALGSVALFSAYYGTDLNGSSAIRFFWDNRAETAMAQSRGSMTNTLEMDMHMSEIVKVVKDQSYYGPLFNKAFASAGEFPGNVNEENVLSALANFVDAMGSYGSKFDQEAAKKYQGGYYGGSTTPLEESFPGFTPEENAGKSLYLSKCAGCHSPIMGRPMFQNGNNGLEATTGTDKGVGGVAEFAGVENEGTFKIPTLRNIALSAPYMHDGRFATLEDVVEHYSTGIKAHPNLGARSGPFGGGDESLPVGGFNFTEKQKSDLIAFLKTTTDNSLVIEKRFSDPFK